MRLAARLGAARRGSCLRTGAAIGRLGALAATLVALAAGCSGGDDGDGAATGATPAEALAEAAASLREQGSFGFTASFTRVLETAPGAVEEYATAEGALELGTGEGRASLELAPLFPGRDNPPPLDEPVELRWDAETVTVGSGDGSREIGRERARENGGLLGRYPDEVDALVGLLADALQPRLLGTEDGAALYAFTIPAREAGLRGVPAELNEAFEQALHGPELRLEARLGDDGLPRRLDYVVRLEPVRSGGKVVLPARTVRVTYELGDFGEPAGPNG